jgi:hypothetical protein
LRYRGRAHKNNSNSTGPIFDLRTLIAGGRGFMRPPPFEGGAQEVSLQATLQVPPELKSERVEFRASTFNGVARQTMLHAIQVDDIKYQPAGDNIA